MISGMLILEDTTINFTQAEKGINVTINDTFSRQIEVLENVPLDKFTKALAIAVHVDGMPDHKKDYEDAESIQGKIRWIP